MCKTFIHTLIRDEVVWNKQTDKKVRRVVDKRDEVGSENIFKIASIFLRNFSVRPPLFITRISFAFVDCDSKLVFAVSCPEVVYVLCAVHCNIIM
jgi:hypothetical protein